MNEHDGEHDSLAERLRRFTPASGALDRDALVFAAGHASAKKHAGWKALAGALATTQLLTLAMLWPRHAESTSLPDAATTIANAPMKIAEPQLTEPSETNPFRLSQMRREFLAVGPESTAQHVGWPLKPDAPPLHAISTASLESLN